MTIKTKIENAFRSFGYFIFDNKFKVLLALLLILAGFISQIPKITADMSSEGSLHEDDPILLQYNQFRAQFGQDDVVLLAIETPDLFTDKTLLKLKNFHNELKENVPYLDKIDSLINARDTRGEEDSLIVEDLFKKLPENSEEMAERKSLALGSKLFKNLFISDDGKFTVILIRTNAHAVENTDDENLLEGFEEETTKKMDSPQVLTDTQNSTMVSKIHEIIAKYKSDDFKIYAAGTPVVVDRIKRAMQHDMQKFTNLSILIIAIVLFMLFRRISGVVMPLIVVALTVLSTFATMAATGVALKPPTQILPSFLMAVGVAASVHILTMFFRYFNQNENKREAIAHALSHSGLPIAMASLTTAAGLLSFSTSEVSPISDLGVFAATGVLLSLIYTLILLPTMIALLPLKRKTDNKTSARAKIMDTLLLKIAKFSTTNYKVILGSSFLLFLIAVGGLTKLAFYHNPLTWIPEDWDARIATELVDVELKGSGFLEIVIDTGEVNGLYDPKIMATIDSLDTKLKALSTEEVFTGKTISVLDIIKESNRALNENNESFYRIPTDRALIAQELLLFENSGSDDLEDFVDSQFSMARISVKTPWTSAASTVEFIELIEQEIENTLDPSLSTYVTGMGALFGRTLDAAIESSKVSYLLAAIIITFMMIALLGKIKLGLISMIPNLLPIIFAMGIMGYFAMPLDMFTMLIGSIAIGLVVDDTIHFMHNFQRYHAQTNSVEEAVEKTLLSTGRALVVTTIVLSLGFFIFMAASMNNVFYFGLITGSTIVFALLADLLLAPALMKVLYEKKQTSHTATGAQ
ncbi:MAG: MMPL family transporter [Gammaproteobacteria bacterium]|nr:MMPL family transporter [Gammaproteobacteria bacterium]